MKESSTYQLILEEGRTEGRTEGALDETKKLLHLVGEEAFGPPDARITAHIERLNDLTQLEELLKRMVTAGSWQELFARPTPGSRKRKAP